MTIPEGTKTMHDRPDPTGFTASPPQYALRESDLAELLDKLRLWTAALDAEHAAYREALQAPQEARVLREDAWRKHSATRELESVERMRLEALARRILRPNLAPEGPQ